MSDKISHGDEIIYGTLSTYPEDIFLAKQQLQRDPMNEELAKHLAERIGIKPEDLNTSKRETYNEYSRSPSFQSRTDYYKTYKSSPQKGNVFDNPNRYDGGGGGKGRQRKYKKRTHTKKYKNSNTRRKSMTKSMKKYV